jgi:hypothetical protein
MVAVLVEDGDQALLAEVVPLLVRGLGVNAPTWCERTPSLFVVYRTAGAPPASDTAIQVLALS